MVKKIVNIVSVVVLNEDEWIYEEQKIWKQLSAVRKTHTQFLSCMVG